MRADFRCESQTQLRAPCWLYCRWLAVLRVAQLCLTSLLGCFYRSNLAVLAAFLERTELPFDLSSALDEVRKQISMEFDFRREAKVMDDIAVNLHDLRKRVVVPRSIPSLVRAPHPPST